MKLSAKEAAAQVGISKQGIIRAIHKGKLSATRNVHGEFEIDPAELFRVYQPVSTDTTTVTSVDGVVTVDQSESLQVKVEMLERMVRDKDEAIMDLRTRLTNATDELTKANARLLEDKQAKGFWARLLGR